MLIPSLISFLSLDIPTGFSLFLSAVFFCPMFLLFFTVFLLFESSDLVELSSDPAQAYHGGFFYSCSQVRPHNTLTGGPGH